ncbi:MAG: hypothetical protein ACOX1P_07455 [Thermoguttaceae bacterium]|jgi:hypothetical protein
MRRYLLVLALADDPGETKNLIDAHPDRAEQMKARLAAIRNSDRSRP